MEEFLTQAIILRATETKEADKTAVILTIDRGKLNCVFKGVRKKGAKLKTSAQPLCFGEYELVGRGFYTVRGCTITDSFYAIASDLDKFFLACVMTEAVDRCTEYDVPSKNIFLLLVKGLNELCYGKASSDVVASKFFLLLMEALGYAQSTDYCAVCGAPVTRYDSLKGGVICDRCGVGTVLTRERYDDLNDVGANPLGTPISAHDGRMLTILLAKGFECVTDTQLFTLKNLTKIS